MQNTKDIEKSQSIDDFKCLYEKYRHHVRKTLFYMAGESELDDLVQQVFLKIWKNKENFKGDSKLKTWIHRITVNTAYDFFKKLKTEKMKLENSESANEATISSSEHQRLEKAEIIRKGILNLSEKQKAVFVLFYEQDLSISEISEALEIEAGTVKSRLSYARKEMIDFLKTNGIQYD